MYHETLNHVITQHLHETGKTQRQLARELGVSEGALVRKRCGSREFTVAEAARLARITGLDVTLWELLAGGREEARAHQ